jgi:integrator complex subunit 9
MQIQIQKKLLKNYWFFSLDILEPSFPYLDALAPFQPLQMKAVHCPIDTSLNFSQAKKLVRDLKPGIIAVPKCYTVPPASAPLRTDLQIEVVSTFVIIIILIF